MIKRIHISIVLLAMTCAVASADSPELSEEQLFTAYYGDARQLQGTELRNTLQSTIKQGHIPITYGTVWVALQALDEDPQNSAKIALFYSGRSADKSDRDGQPGFDEDSWNREHIWPISYGFGRDEKLFGYTDLHHIRPEDKSVNAARGNKRFDVGGTAQGEAPDTLTGKDTWQPRAAIRGDVARMLFYMDVRYDGNDGDMPDLTLADSTDMAIGSTTFGKLCTLLAWHWADPVDTAEAVRNGHIYGYQGNRNPFIDNPIWADELWGKQCPDVQVPATVARPVFNGVSTSSASTSSSAAVSSASSAPGQKSDGGGGSVSAVVVLLAMLLGALRIGLRTDGVRIGGRRRQ